MQVEPGAFLCAKMTHINCTVSIIPERYHIIFLSAGSLFISVYKLLFKNTSGMLGHNTHFFPLIQTQKLFSQTQESSTMQKQK